jgi:DNA repair protein RadC
MAALELGRAAAEEPLREQRRPGQPAAYAASCSGISAAEREVFCCLFLDAQHRLLRCEDLFLGTLDGAAVYPREVARGPCAAPRR